jgi:hypothetical protein
MQGTVYGVGEEVNRYLTSQRLLRLQTENPILYIKANRLESALTTKKTSKKSGKNTALKMLGYAGIASLALAPVALAVENPNNFWAKWYDNITPTEVVDTVNELNNSGLNTSDVKTAFPGLYELNKTEETIAYANASLLKIVSENVKANSKQSEALGQQEDNYLYELDPSIVNSPGYNIYAVEFIKNIVEPRPIKGELNDENGFNAGMVFLEEHSLIWYTYNDGKSGFANWGAGKNASIDVIEYNKYGAPIKAKINSTGEVYIANGDIFPSVDSNGVTSLAIGFVPHKTLGQEKDKRFKKLPSKDFIEKAYGMAEINSTKSRY